MASVVAELPNASGVFARYKSRVAARSDRRRGFLTQPPARLSRTNFQAFWGSIQQERALQWRPQAVDHTFWFGRACAVRGSICQIGDSAAYATWSRSEYVSRRFFAAGGTQRGGDGKRGAAAKDQPHDKQQPSKATQRASRQRQESQEEQRRKPAACPSDCAAEAATREAIDSRSEQPRVSVGACGESSGNASTAETRVKEVATPASVFERYPCMASAAHTPSLKSALTRFKAAAAAENEKTGALAWSTYEGWPPRSRIKVGDEKSRFGPLGREIFLFNRRLGNRRRREPCMAICCSGRCVLLLSEREFDALMKLMPWVKNELAEFKKLI